MGKTSKKQKSTLIDVAAKAGVSAITVSRTIRAPHLVSPKAKKKVKAAIEELGYVPDAAASALASNRTDVIGLLIPSLTNSVFAEVLRGVYDEVENTPYSIQIGNYRYSPLTEEKLIGTFLRQKPAGLIVAGLDQTETSRKMLWDASCPIVQFMEFDKDPVDSMIGFSHFEAGGAATRHLLEQGYENIGFLGARMDPRSQRRLAGFRQVLGEQGRLSEHRILTTARSSSVSLGADMLSELLVNASDSDAIFCNNDDLAIGALLQAQRRGIRIPKDFGICGFNDLEISKQLSPGLTSVATPRYGIGKMAINTIVRSLETDPAVARVRLDLGYEVIPRGSSARLEF